MLEKGNGASAPAASKPVAVVGVPAALETARLRVAEKNKAEEAGAATASSTAASGGNLMSTLADIMMRGDLSPTELATVLAGNVPARFSTDTDH